MFSLNKSQFDLISFGLCFYDSSKLFKVLLSADFHANRLFLDTIYYEFGMDTLVRVILWKQMFFIIATSSGFEHTLWSLDITIHGQFDEFFVHNSNG